VNASKARRSLRNGFITLVLAGALVVGLLLAVPGLKGVATTVSNMKTQWVVTDVSPGLADSRRDRLPVVRHRGAVRVLGRRRPDAAAGPGGAGIPDQLPVALWVPAVWGTIAFIVLQKTKAKPIVLRNPPEELRTRPH
jgi:hypothetical protein